jgi:hypothetical protein
MSRKLTTNATESEAIARTLATTMGEIGWPRRSK